MHTSHTIFAVVLINVCTGILHYIIKNVALEPPLPYDMSLSYSPHAKSSAKLAWFIFGQCYACKIYFWTVCQQPPQHDTVRFIFMLIARCDKVRYVPIPPARTFQKVLRFISYSCCSNLIWFDLIWFDIIEFSNFCIIIDYAFKVE